MNEADIILQARTVCRDGKPQEALSFLNAARTHCPSPAILIEMATILDAMNLSPSALSVLEQGMRQFAAHPAMVIAFANLCYKNNQPIKGLNATHRLATLPVCSMELLLTHAHLLKANGQAEEAVIFYKKALAIDPKNGIALSSLGGIELDARHYPEALEYVRTAHALEPTNAHIETQLATAEFRSGDLSHGWIHYDARFGNAHSEGIVKRRPFLFPKWNGKPLRNGKLLVWCEQGVGEELLYSTMLRDAQNHCPDGVMVECDKRLKPLFERSFESITFIARCDPPDAVLSDTTIVAQCSAGQLGRFFRTTFADFPKHPIPLRAHPALVNELHERYEQEKIRRGKTGHIVGVSWKSKPLRQGDPKSSAFSDWHSLFESSPHLFVSLQYGECTDEMNIVRQNNWPLIVDESVQQHHSLDDFAAQVCAIDYIISVSNTTAHMAGRCGKPCAILLPASKGLMWHWFDKERPDAETAFTTSAWYPSARLLRQEKDGTWNDVLATARHILERL